MYYWPFLTATFLLKHQFPILINQLTYLNTLKMVWNEAKVNIQQADHFDTIFTVNIYFLPFIHFFSSPDCANVVFSEISTRASRIIVTTMRSNQ